MKNKSIPITMLRDTGAIDELVNSSNEPIYVTKNGYDDFMIVPKGAYKHKLESTYENKNFGFIRIKTDAIKTINGDIDSNAQEIISSIERAEKEDVNFLVTQELSLIGKTADDLLLFESTFEKLKEAINRIVSATKDKNLFVAFGCPILISNSMYNCAICVQNGTILGIVPKFNVSSNRLKNDSRHFNSYKGDNIKINIGGNEIPFGNSLSFRCLNDQRIIVGIEIGDDLYNVGSSTSNRIGKTIILNLGSNIVTNTSDDVDQTVASISKLYKCGYAYCDCNYTECSTGFVFGSKHVIAENGALLAVNERFNKMYITMDIDIDIISNSKISVKSQEYNNSDSLIVSFNQHLSQKKNILHPLNIHPFIPQGDLINQKFVSDTMAIQANALANRMRNIHCTKAVIGLSGGLDSALALLVINEAFKILRIDNKNIYAFSMPCFGTTSRTKTNSEILGTLLGVTFKEVNLGESVEAHLKDLEVDDSNRSVAFENAQARERTQFLMDYANLIGGFVVGTGDLSELALGWCTYNGDHMSMYDPNGGVSKTLVKYLVKGYGLTHPKLKAVLEDILGTPISPELLPGTNGDIAQLTEENIGPYELQDFYIYNYVKYGFSPAKLYYLSNIGFEKLYSKEEQLKWLKVFFKRFYSSQFKRNAIPDSPKICDIDLAPGGFLKLASDLNYSYILKDIEKLEK